MTYTQVKLESIPIEEDPHVGGYFYVCWIPTKFAILGKVVEFTTGIGRWKVIEKYGVREEQDVLAQERLYLKHRKGSDI